MRAAGARWQRELTSLEKARAGMAEYRIPPPEVLQLKEADLRALIRVLKKIRHAGSARVNQRRAIAMSRLCTAVSAGWLTSLTAVSTAWL